MRSKFGELVRRRFRVVLPIFVALLVYFVPSHLTAPLTRRFTAAVSRFCSGFSRSDGGDKEGGARGAALARAELEIARLRRSLNALAAIRKWRRIETPLLPARIVLRTDSSPVRLSVLLDVGSEDGVRVGMPVLWGRPADGAILVGVVKQLYRKGCRVALVGDIFVRVPVVVSPSGAEAMLVSDGETLFLKFLDSGRVRVGDAVLTSGYTGLFPEGVLVGYVVPSAETDSSVVAVRAAFRLRGMDTVFVALVGARE